MEKDIRLKQGESYAWQPSTAGALAKEYKVTLEKVEQVQGANYTALRATVNLQKGDTLLEVLHPEKRQYSSGMPMTEAAIRAGFFRDIYVALGESLPNNSWALRVYDKPLVRWLWLGAILMALGGLLVMLDKRYRIKKLLEAMNAKGASYE